MRKEWLTALRQYLHSSREPIKTVVSERTATYWSNTAGQTTYLDKNGGWLSFKSDPFIRLLWSLKKGSDPKHHTSLKQISGYEEISSLVDCGSDYWRLIVLQLIFVSSATCRSNIMRIDMVEYFAVNVFLQTTILLHYLLDAIRNIIE